MKLCKYLIMLNILTISQLMSIGFNNEYSLKNKMSKVEIKKIITLKILLVEFEDVKHRSAYNQVDFPSSAYTYEDFNNMLFSENLYKSPRIYSPDGKEVFGSLRDYYLTMSNDKLEINGYILNEDKDNNNIPDWISLNKSKRFYHNLKGDQFRQESKQKAKMLGLDITKDDSTFLAIIYAGHTYRSNSNSLNPEAFFEEHEYIMGERFASCFPYEEERDVSSIYPVSHFSHIGIHVHELGHLLGFDDHDGGKDNEHFGLMSKGCFNGPLNEGACPSPLNPYYRWMKGWIHIYDIPADSTLRITYDLKNPNIYKLKDTYSQNFFLIEFRKFDIKIDSFSNEEYDFNSFIKSNKMESGILVWRKLNGHFVKLLYSSGINCEIPGNQIFPGEHNIRILSPWSDDRNCRPGYYWVPNTKPTVNCGFEIKEFSNSNTIVDFYIVNPLNSSPAIPKELSSNSISNVSLKWNSNKEPDLHYYQIYKKKDETVFTFYDSIDSNLYIDDSEIYDTTNSSKTFVYYKITAVDSSGKSSTFSMEIKIPVVDSISGCEGYPRNDCNKFTLYQNYPNPFNPTTKINYSIPKESIVTIKVFDVLGKEVTTLVNQRHTVGHHQIELNANNLSSGIYFYNLQAGDYVETKKMIFLK